MASIQKAKALRKQDYLKGNDSCLKNVGNNEPIFVLRAQDIFAPLLVSMWAQLVGGIRGDDYDKVTGAKEIARQMQKWKNRKVPD